MQANFQRYTGSDSVPDRARMTCSLIQAHTSPRTISELLFRLETFTKDEAASRAEYPWATRFVMGYPLPAWQRPLVWTDDQKSRFITSLWMEIDVGSYLVNDVCDFMVQDGKQTYTLHSDVLLDGQQRLSALEEYFFGRIAVPDKDGIPTLWAELSKVERRKFSNRSFNRSVVHSWDEAELRRIYDLRAFGGTAHTDDQRASVVAVESV